MLLDDNCIRLNKILDSGFPLVCQAEMSRYANIRADHTTLYILFSPFPPPPPKNSRSHEWHYGIISGRKLCRRLCHIGTNCLHIWWTTAQERRARIIVTFFNIVPPWSRYTSVHKILSRNQYLLTGISRLLSPKQLFGCGYIHYDVFLAEMSHFIASFAKKSNTHSNV